MAQSKEFADGSRALNEASHALALLEAENNRLQRERDELRDLAHDMLWCTLVGDCLMCKWGKGDKCELDHAKRASELGIEVK